MCIRDSLEACLRASLTGNIGISEGSTASAAKVLSSLFQVKHLFNTSDAQSFRYAANVTTVLRIISTVQLRGAFPGSEGLSMTGDLVRMQSYRSSLAAMNAALKVRLINNEAATLASASFADFSADDFVTDTDGVVDVKVATLGTNIFKHSFKGSAGTAAGKNWNGGTGSVNEDQAMRLRSKVVVIEVSLEDSTLSLIHI